MPFMPSSTLPQNPTREARAGLTIAVVGATGKQGGAVAKHLLQEGWAVRALSRHPNGEAQRRLLALGASITVADMDDPSSLDRALQGAYGVFSVQNFYEPGVGKLGEIAQGCRVADAAMRAGVQHLVQSTMARARDADEVEHFASKRAVEQHLATLPMAVTTLGTVWFMDNLLVPALGGLRSMDALQGTLGNDRPMEMLAVDDIGALAAAMFAAPQRWRGRHVNAAGDRLTVGAMRATYRRVIGQPPTRWAWPMPNTMLKWFNPDFAAQLRWQARVGWDFALGEALAVVPSMTTFAAFLERSRTSLRR